MDLFYCLKQSTYSGKKYYDCIDYAVQHSILDFGSQELIESIPEKRYQDLIQPIRSNFDTDQEILARCF